MSSQGIRMHTRILGRGVKFKDFMNKATVMIFLNRCSIISQIR
jgi:hypothetical protein